MGDMIQALDRLKILQHFQRGAPGEPRHFGHLAGQFAAGGGLMLFVGEQSNAGDNYGTASFGIQPRIKPIPGQARTWGELFSR